MKKQNNDKLILQTQGVLIVILAVALIMVTVVGITFAWYTRFISDKLNIKLSNPVEIYITDENFDEDGKLDDDAIIDSKDKLILPGTKIKLKLGFVMGKEDKPSSPAYVRVKLTVKTKEPVAGGVEVDDLLWFDSVPLKRNWVEVDFKEEGKWWVFAEKSEEDIYSARIARNMENHNFIDGTVQINTSLTNIYANKTIILHYEVKAIQSENVENPILDIENPTWGKLKESAN